ncbi:MAG TPA: GPP34 family phosphoprotein [Catenuloplanes sp.]
MLLADELYFLAHEDSTGKPRLHPRALGLGLAAALLGELVLFERVTVQQGTVGVLDRRPPDDALAHTTLDQLVGEQQQHTVRTWLTFLAQNAPADVAQRLARAGQVQIVETRRLFTTSKTYVPVNPSTAAWPENRLRHTFTQGKPISIPDATLAGLAGVAGLVDRFLWDADSNARRYYSYAVQSLPAPLRELVAHTEAAVGDAVLSHRP